MVRHTYCHECHGRQYHPPIHPSTQVEVSVEGGQLPDGLQVIGLARTASAESSPIGGGYLVIGGLDADAVVDSDGAAVSGAVLVRVVCQDGSDVSVARLHNRNEHPTEKALKAKVAKLHAKSPVVKLIFLRLKDGVKEPPAKATTDPEVSGWGVHRRNYSRVPSTAHDS